MKDVADDRVLEALVENSPDGEITFDAAGRVSFANSAAAKLFGFSRRALIGKTYAELASGIETPAGETIGTAGLPVARAFKSNAPVVDFVHILRRHDGASRIVVATA